MFLNIRINNMPSPSSPSNAECGRSAPPRRRRSHLSQIAPRRRPQSLSPRAYQTRLDLCRVWDFLCQRKRPSEIAQAMGKDPAWVSRAIKKVQSDFSTVYQKPKESRLIEEQLARLESLYARAAATAETTEGANCIMAIRTAASVLREQFQFLQYTGMIQKNTENLLRVSPEKLAEKRKRHPFEGLFGTSAQ